MKVDQLYIFVRIAGKGLGISYDRVYKKRINN